MFDLALADLSQRPLLSVAVGSGSVLLGCAVLVTVAMPLSFGRYAALALSLQWCVAFLHGLPRRSERYYDVSGSVTHLTLVTTSLIANRRSLSPRAILVSILVVVWCTRLGTFLMTRILRDGIDTRFDHVKRSTVRFLGAWTAQAVWVFLLQIPVLILHTHEEVGEVTVLDLVGWGLWVTGFVMETVADTQKTIFRNLPENRDKFITSGLWAYSRHPNFLGEILLWVGIGLSTLSTHLSGLEYLGVAAPVGITLLLLCKVTGIPPLGTAGMRRWGKDESYRHYVQNTNLLWIGRRAGRFDKLQ